MLLKGKTADKLYGKFALPIFLMAFAAVVAVPVGYTYGHTPEGQAKIQQVGKAMQEKTSSMLATVQNKNKKEI